MTNIEKYSKIRREQLSGEFYFQSLLEEAAIQGELSQPEMENIQMQCIKLLAENVERYNKGESSSVRVEAAQSIMASNFFTMGIYLKSLPDVSTALEYLKKEPVSKLYQLGKKVINSKLNVANHLYQLVCKTKIKTPCYTYNATIDEGIKSFFNQYNVDYEAHETAASIDYQLMDPVTDLAGVEYIIKYLQSLYTENLFCSLFNPAVIHEVMLGYDEKYKDSLANIFSHVLQNALGCAALGKDILYLDLVLSDIQRLKETFLNKTKESIYYLLQSYAEMVVKALGITSESSKAYIYASLPEFSARILNAAGNDMLQTVFVPRRDLGAEQVIRYSMGKKMNNEDYRKIVNEVMECRYIDDKIKIIRGNIKTLSDIEDIIMDCELEEVEALAVFKLLNDIDMAVLVKRHPQQREINAVDFSEAEIKLQSYLEKYLQSLSKEKVEKLKKTSVKIRS